MSEIISKAKIADVDTDISNIGKSANELGHVNPRYGNRYKTIPQLSMEFQQAVQDALLAGQNLQQAIDTALAAGAGQAGWTASLVVDGDKNQHQINEENAQQSVKNYSNLPAGLFTGQPAKFNGIQYIWDGSSSVPPEDNLIIQPIGVSVGRWVIHSYDGCIYSDTVNDQQSALDYCAKNKLKYVLTSNITVDKDLYIRTFEADSSTDRFVFDGQSHKLKFTAGGLHIQTAEMNMFDLTAETTDVSAKASIILRPFLRPYDSTVGYPTRGTYTNVRAERCETNGWYISNTWINYFFGCYARYCKKWGICLDHLDTELGYYNISCNNFGWYGGEIQGNGNNITGEFGGVYLGRLIGGAFHLATIEGNYGNGVNIVGATNNFIFDHCYIEKNGVLATNRDAYAPQVTAAANRARNVTFIGTNHTANGKNQERAFELYDVINLRIINPVFFGSASNKYELEPIYVGESISTYSSGYVENPSLVYSGYTQKPLFNDCARFGKLKKLSGLSGFDFNANVDTSKYLGASETLEHLGKYSKFTFLFVAQPLTSTAPVRITLSARRYPTPTEFSLFSKTVAPVANTVSSVSHQVTIANKSEYNGGITWVASRIGTHSEDISTDNLQCVGAAVEYYVGVI